MKRALAMITLIPFLAAPECPLAHDAQWVLWLKGTMMQPLSVPALPVPPASWRPVVEVATLAECQERARIAAAAESASAKGDPKMSHIKYDDDATVSYTYRYGPYENSWMRLQSEYVCLPLSDGSV